jgi:cytochrome c553
MRAIVSDLSDKDMEDIAAYYGAAPVTTAEKK